MAVVPGFKYDLFISYAHQNDRPWRWVTEFIQTLKAELETKSRDLTIWWDPGLRTGENFDIAIADAISQSATFLSVLSLAYGDSTYCRKEMEEFRQQQRSAFGLEVGSMSRMQAICIEREYTRDRWAPEFRRTSPHLFYDEQTSLFSKPASLAAADPWIHGLWKVRDSIWAVLHDMKEKTARGTKIDVPSVPSSTLTRTPVVHLAEVTDDLYRPRERLRSSLKEIKDLEVLAWSGAGAPATSGPSVRSVHLFGKFAGRAHGTGDLHLSCVQLEETIRSKPARPPLVWLARDLKLEEAETPEHRVFLESLAGRNDVELLRTDFEDLKDELTKRMRELEVAEPKTDRGPHESPIIHIWHSMANPAELRPLKQYLSDHDCGISVFNCVSTPMETIQSRLAVCDGLIVPYTPETRTWAEDVLTEAFRLRRREERPTAFAAVELPPASDAEFNFEHPRVVPVHVHRQDGFGDMSQFLAKLERVSA